jgi:hypothetical protein
VKFGIGIYFDARKVLGLVSTLYPNPWDHGALNRVWQASTTLKARLGKNVIKLKL